MARKVADSEVYVLKITLRGGSPPIWRRIRISGGASLMDLHRAIQAVMGWDGYHMFSFEKNRVCFSDVSMFDDMDDVDFADAGAASIQELLPRVKDKCLYLYDFGDSWEHEVVLEKKEEYDPGRPLPECIAGKSACPPEDCGGLYGYYNLLEILADPAHEEYESVLEWVGGPFDPSHFDLERAKRELASAFRPRKPRK